ncbi:biotin-dependent carboxyltransferase family protein [Devosia sp. LjRoot3]|uniref:5-oxoprolinase subunit C family protein n=1 Tax=Devosia sp. LjRoot3 TaxID=3342319 RepID=UPI003F4F8A44
MEILSSTPLATIQDIGRFDHYHDGVGRSGAMDGLALAIGNALLGNDANAAAIEIPLLPFKLRFEEDLDIAITGADCEALLDDVPLPPDWALSVKAGQTLTLSAIREGCRAYICVVGGFDVPEVLGSRSTQLRETFGGHEGRMLKKGDRLKALGTSAGLPPGGLGATPFTQEPGPVTARVLPAAEYERFTAESQRSFWTADWQVTPQSNRNGYRLSGPNLTMKDTSELRSHGVVPGTIQVPMGGQPIIQLADAATMGGYPKFGTVIEPDHWRLAQAKPGTAIRFVEVDYPAALAAQAELDAYIADIRASAGRQRRAASGWQS